jgi:uncharacterized protein (DUF58 family)
VPASALLEPAAVARLADLKLRARTIVEGALSGLHRSPHHGAAIEFAEHKEYSPGDEIRHIDWKAYGKFDKYYVKRYEEETELRAFLVVDCSASMGYAGAGGTSKLTYATWLAAALAWLLLRQQDQASMLAFAGEVRAFVPPRSRAGHLVDLLSSLERLEAAGKTDLGRAVDYVSNVARRRAMVVLMSDLLDGGEAALPLLRGLRARHHDVVLLHVLDGDELRLPFDAPTRFEGLEGPEWLLADPRAIRAGYLEAVGRFVDGLRRGCQEGDIGYQLVDTSRPPAEVLLELLRSRQR